jgi:hypothetical protein
MLIAVAPRRWYCRCDCGGFAVRTIESLTSSLRIGNTASCGCVVKEAVSAIRTTHGATRGRALGQGNHPLYATWVHMRARCTRPGHPDWKNYGARGIRVCDRWLSFANFLADMGERPPGMTIDRKNNNGNYEPGNVRWATRQQQSANRRPSTLWRRRGRPRAAQ